MVVTKKKCTFAVVNALMRDNLMNFINKLGILKNIFVGNVIKIKVLYDIHILKSIKLSDFEDSSVVVSLTSYGNRVRKCVAYTAYSLLTQSVRPSCVVLWLDQESFNDQNIPEELKFLRKFGLEIRYCKDIKSYTKIIYSLSAFSDKHIITVDDDLYYTKDFIKEFVETHRKYPQDIITAWAKQPICTDNGQLASYKEWPEIKSASEGFKYNGQKLLPLGVGGVLYPAHVFNDEVFKESVFLSLCPKADDIWLYIMGLRSGVYKRLLVNSRISYYQTDTLRQYLTSDRLTESNRLGGENDLQLEALLDYYQIPIEKLCDDI